MIERGSSLWPVEVAVAAAIKADVTLQGMLAGDMVYSRIAPATIADTDDDQSEIETPYPHVVLGERTETPNGAPNTFDRAAEAGSLTVHIWTSDVGKNEQLSLIYRQLARVLSAPLTLSSGMMYSGILSYVTDSYDPEGEAMHGVCDYRRLTTSAA